MLVTINVTDQDINSGVPASACWCPVSQAIQRQTRFGYVATNRKELVLAEGFAGDRTVVPTPDNVNAFIDAFDRRKVNPDAPVRPFSFQIDIPDRFVKTPAMSTAL